MSGPSMSMNCMQYAYRIQVDTFKQLLNVRLQPNVRYELHRYEKCKSCLVVMRMLSRLLFVDRRDWGEIETGKPFQECTGEWKRACVKRIFKPGPSKVCAKRKLSYVKLALLTML